MDELRYQVDLLKAMNQKLSGRERMFKLVCETVENAFLYFDFSVSEIVTLGSWDRFFSVRVSDTKEILDLLDEFEDEYILPVRDALFLEKTGEERCSVECRTKNGRFWLEITVNVTYDEADAPTDKVVCVRDITKFKFQNDELQYMAYYDEATGLYNRNYFVMQLDRFVKKAGKEQCIVSVMIIDIDDFRKINDGLGMLVGDEVVQQYGQYLGTFADENVIVGHINSDIFCMAVYDPCGDRSVDKIHKNIMSRIEEGFHLSNGTEVHMTVSIGVAEYPEASESVLELINCAEIVMFKAKSAGKASIQYYDEPILREFRNTVAVENKLKEAVFNKNFCLHFQPQYYSGTGQLRGVEALIRWRDENNRIISPSIFIPIAEKNGAIVPIGSWVLEESIQLYAQWKRRYGYSFILSINISAIQYRRKDFVLKLLDVIRKNGVEPSEIELEITESILIEDFAEVKEKMTILRDYGFKISLDDFGTGFSSLSYLNGLPIDTLKIDKSFVDRICTDPSTKVITETIVSMVHRLGYESVAEGVETKEQYECVRQIGCDVIQGFYLDRPMPAEEIEKLLIKQL